VKIADNANIRELEEDFFIANTDTYGGNSGSPVFSTGRLNNNELFVEGILVRGEDDFEDDFEAGPSCLISKKCSNEGCTGEDITYANKLSKVIP